MLLGEGAAAGGRGAGSAASVAAGSTATGASRASRASLEPFAAVLSPTRQRSTAPTRSSNHRRIGNALATVFFAGGANVDRLKVMRRVIEDHGDRQLVLALASSGARSNGSLVGIYAVIESEEEAAEAVRSCGAGTNPRAVLARRVFGTTCPPLLLPQMVHTLLKFDTAARNFRQIGFSCTFTVTTDAVGMETAHMHTSHGAGAATSATPAVMGDDD